MTISKKFGRAKLDQSLKKVPLFVNLPQWLIDWLRSQPESNAIIIERALINEYDIRFDTSPIDPIEINNISAPIKLSQSEADWVNEIKAARLKPKDPLGDPL